MAGAAILLAPLSACGSSDQQVAQRCGVSLASLEHTKAAVKAMQPYAGADLGKCSVIKDDSGVDVVLPEAKRNAELMVRYESILNGVADRCGAPHDVWGVVSADQVQLVRKSSDAGKMDCLLSEFRKSKLRVELSIIDERHQ